MALTVKDGALLVRNGSLGTEQACCCDNGECSSSDQCCVCIAFYFKVTPGDACVSPFYQDPLEENVCVFVGDGVPCPCSFIPGNPETCPDPTYDELAAAMRCAELHPEVLAFSTPGAASGGFCCNNVCQASPCDDPP